jgi:conjugal transfer ATP-binding protein TraC
MIRQLSKFLDGYITPLFEEAASCEQTREKNTGRGREILKDYHSFGELLEYEAYDSSSEIYYNRSSKGILIEADPMSGASDEDMEAFYALFQRLLPEGAMIQFLIYASPFIGDELDSYAAEREESSPVMRKLAAGRAAYWKRGIYKPLIKGEAVVLRDFKCLIALTLDNTLELNENKILALKTSLLGTLKSARMRPRMLEPGKLIEWVRCLTLPKGEEYLKEARWNELDALRTAMVNNDYLQVTTPERIDLYGGERSKYEIRNYGISSFGKESPHLAEMSDLVGGMFDVYAQVGCPFSFSLAIKIADQVKERRAAQVKCARAIQRAGMIGKISPKAIDEAHEARACVKKLEEAERVVIVSAQSSIYCRHEEAERHEADLFGMFQSASRKWELSPNKLIQLPMLTFHLPMNQTLPAMEDLGRLGKNYRLWASNVAGMLPVLAEAKGMNSRKLMIVERRGQIFFFDPFGNNRGNYNTAVAGISGAGKSVTVQDTVCSLVGTGGRVFIIDVGRSYKNLCNLLGGLFVEFRYDTPICLNPFSSINEEEEFIGFMVPLLCLMINPGGEISSIELSFLSRAVKEVLKVRGRKGEINDIIDWLLKEGDERAEDLGNMLFPFGSRGQYGKYFNGESNADFNNPFVVFELEEISGNKRFQNVIFAVLLNQVSEKMYLGGRKQKIALVIDEAWDMLKGGSGGAIIESVARRARKYKGALITITQGLEDYFSSPAGIAAYTNSYWKMIHMQNKENIEALIESKKIVLNSFQKRLLYSVKTEHGVYSELMIKGDGGECVVGRMLLDPYSRVLYSTQATDYEAISGLCGQGIDLAEAIEIVARKNFSDEF